MTLTAQAAVSRSASSSPTPPQWQQPPATSNNGEGRSVTPAMNNTRGASMSQSMYPSRDASPTKSKSQPINSNTTANSASASASANQYNININNNNISSNNNRTMSPQPQRYFPHSQQNHSGNNGQEHQKHQQQQDSAPSSTGLIRLTLRKPMGIVFEPMYDPNQPSVQKGVRICDLPRTGAAALSRKLEIGDELLSINDKTMSRLTFDEIMDFIIEADPEQVNLLFRRPRKEVLAARNALKAPPSNKHTSNANAASVKWIDEDGKSPSRRDKNKARTTASAVPSSSSAKKKKTSSKKDRHDDDTLETDDAKPIHKKKGKRDPYENESFLDLLIDTICANPDAVCKSADRQGDNEYDSDEDEDDRTLTSYDDSTYVTYESEAEKKPLPARKDKAAKKLPPPSADSETEDETFAGEEERHRSKMLDLVKSLPPTANKQPYEDDETLETTETTDRLPSKTIADPSPKSPLGLAVVHEVQPAPPPEPPKQPLQAQQLQHHHHIHQQQNQNQQQQVRMMPQMLPLVDDEKNKAPIAELEYDDQVEADVSVMESLGGPSLLIEQRRQQAAVHQPKDVVPAEIVNEFGSDYPADFGFTREQTIGRDPVRFYSHVVKKLLEQHEPEKVRLLDKLLAKYKGREDHLVQKLSVRYRRGETPEEEDAASFSEAVNKNKESESTERKVQKAQERAAATFGTWPEKETKEQEPVDIEREESEEGSEFSGDSIDGTSPAVIAQVSELLNYVYGKTSVPGQIDRVSTIMRAYEGREAVLLELLETKALIKANSEKENAANLPSFLRNSPALDQKREEDDMVSPLSSPNTGMNQQPVGGNIINDDISSMSGVSSPVLEHGVKAVSAYVAFDSTNVVVF